MSLRNQEAEKYWHRFLQTGKIDDFLKYRKYSELKVTNTDLEIGKIEESYGLKNAKESKVYRNSSKKY